jgi:hypothetical protein
MSSQRKIDANRRNAQHSTGPRTPQGKGKVATNSCTHGLCSRNAILPEEDPAEWRLRRALRIQTGILPYAMEKCLHRLNACTTGDRNRWMCHRPSACVRQGAVRPVSAPERNAASAALSRTAAAHR